MLDLRLPKLDGWQVAERLREDAETETIPLVFLTAHTDAATRERGLALGATDFVTKPFEVQDLPRTCTQPSAVSHGPKEVRSCASLALGFDCRVGRPGAVRRLRLSPLVGDEISHTGGRVPDFSSARSQDQ